MNSNGLFSTFENLGICVLSGAVLGLFSGVGSSQNGDYAASIKWVREFHKANDEKGGGGEGGAWVVDKDWTVEKVDEVTQKYDDKKSTKSSSGTFEHDGFAIIYIAKDAEDGFDKTNNSKLYVKISGREVYARPGRQNSCLNISIPVRGGTSWEAGFSGSVGANCEYVLNVWLLRKP